MRHIDRVMAEVAADPIAYRAKVQAELEAIAPSRSKEWLASWHRQHRKTEAGSKTMHRSNLKARHGISIEQYSALYQSQRGACAICGTAINRAYEGTTGKKGPKPNSAHIDHDHRCCSGKKACGNCVRGLLCSNCNHGLGSFKDSLERLEAAIAYLKR
jgi:hypothetical protein